MYRKIFIYLILIFSKTKKYYLLSPVFLFKKYCLLYYKYYLTNRSAGKSVIFFVSIKDNKFIKFVSSSQNALSIIIKYIFDSDLTHKVAKKKAVFLIVALNKWYWIVWIGNNLCVEIAKETFQVKGSVENEEDRRDRSRFVVSNSKSGIEVVAIAANETKRTTFQEQTAPGNLFHIISMRVDTQRRFDARESLGTRSISARWD